MLHALGMFPRMALAGGSRCRHPGALNARRFISANRSKILSALLEPAAQNFERIDADQRSALMNSSEESAEHNLKLELLKEMPCPLARYPFLYLNEWECKPGLSQHGKGDLVFAGPEWRFAVVETKWIDLASSGATARRRRTKHRRHVWIQAMEYTLALPNLLHRMGVECKGIAAFTFTNEDRLQSVVSNPVWPSDMRCRNCDDWFPEFVPDPTQKDGFAPAVRCAVCCESLIRVPPAE
mmetsp:Transcript_90273/g.291913  ORF Transcript_90273/g.291913 Transcript_90273/m.291913 type:complete len:239 (-) Transcript_90273:100-816(-)